jgi:acetylcholinesterase
MTWYMAYQYHSYRLNIFGFPNARALPDGEQNLALLDQRLALEWM